MIPPPPRSSRSPYATVFRSRPFSVVIRGRLEAAPLGRPCRVRRGRADDDRGRRARHRSEEHTSELQSLTNLVCRLLLEKKKKKKSKTDTSTGKCSHGQRSHS